ncbi:hypothetical protein DMB92_07925 [Campylobacter sp. MIT 99-7217]|uniref:ABC transporter permease n=1 Tax=Campylobacter sp. MIT 99-7217 TaxID=535091 RepID=UPI00115B00AE|nr:FtsX-like permease family protein [Campylobacter sp. MIT 99-7217]TQR29524.1 hypothetical protein DMB92_07925 [Campylobacter sp. MIT 99-7217]
MGNKFLWTQIFKSLIFSYQRLFVIVLAIFIGSMVSSAFLNVYFDIDTKLSKELKAYGANMVISPKNSNFISNEEFQSLKQKLEARALTPYLYAYLNLGSLSGVVLGTDFKELKLTKPFMEVKEGSFSLSDFDEHSAFVGVDLAKQLEAKVGQDIQIYNPNTAKSVKLKIKAILISNDEFDSLLLMPLRVLQSLNDNANINFANALVYGNFDEVNAKALSVSNDFLYAKPISSVSLSESLILNKIKALMFLIILVVLIIASTSVNTTLSSVIFSRKKEIALHLALGSSKKDIIKLFGFECLLLTILASVLGALCGYFLANIFGYLIFNAGIDFRFQAFVIAVLISLIFSFMAAFFPIKKALNINVCENLKGE